MTLRLDLDEIRARVAERLRQQRAERDADLRERGVAVIETDNRRRKYSQIIPASLARVLPWRRRQD
jgi:uncharacterized protein (DUF58 family)